MLPDGERKGMKTGLIILAIVAVAPLTAAAQTPASRSHFEPGPCAVDVAADERIDCGVLVVPENRSLTDSRLIRLPVLIFRSRAAQAAPDPVMFLNGGPGNSTLTGQRSGRSNPFLEARDQVLLEPRGARLSQPALDCPQINALKSDIAAGRRVGEAAETQFVQLSLECRTALIASGIDLNGYTSAETADDIEDLRVALGYPQINLYGLSYGTRLALTMARRHPGSVRAMVLDSVLPPEVDYDETATANIWRALNLVFDGCATDPVCSAAWPDLKQDFQALMQRVDRDGLPFGQDNPGSELRGAQIVEALGMALNDPQLIALIPRAIGTVAEGRHDELVGWIVRSQQPSNYNWGLRLSIWCGEEAPFEDPAVVGTQTSVRHGIGGADARTASPAVCEAWNVAAASEIERTAVKTDIPTLILAGQFDPVTPPVWGRRLLANMPNALFVELAGRSHGASFNACGGRMAFDFIVDPTTPPDMTCVAKLPGIDFGLSAAPAAP